jgi:hypothetical protein
VPRRHATNTTTTAADEVLAFHTDVQMISPGDLGDSRHRTDARMFVYACLTVPCRSAFHRPCAGGRRHRRDGRGRRCPAGFRELDAGSGRPTSRGQAVAGGRARGHETCVTGVGSAGGYPAAGPGRELPADSGARIQAAAVVVAAAKDGKAPEHLLQALEGMADLVLAGNGTDTVAHAAGVLADAALTIAEIHDDPAPCLRLLTGCPGFRRWRIS